MRLNRYDLNATLKIIFIVCYFACLIVGCRYYDQGNYPQTAKIKLALGEHHTCAQTGLTDIWCWGWADHGQLGAGNLTHDISRDGKRENTVSMPYFPKRVTSSELHLINNITAVRCIPVLCSSPMAQSFAGGYQTNLVYLVIPIMNQIHVFVILPSIVR